VSLSFAVNIALFCQRCSVPPSIPTNFLDLATASGFVRHFTPQFHFRIITADPDDDIFADCAIAADAEYIIAEDGHFKALRNAGYKPQPITPEEFIRQFLSPS